MRFLSKLIALAVIVSMTVACGRNAQNRVDAQGDHGPNGIGAANSSTTDSATVSDTDNTEHGNLHQGTGDAYFVKTASDGGLLEVKLGELAAKNGSSTKVKEFGRTMTIDHTRANEELKSIAEGLNISITDALSENNQKQYDDFAQMKDGDFDKAYAKLMVANHQETIDIFRAASNNGGQQSLREWAGAKIPNLEHHLQMAQKLNDSATASKGQ